MTCEISVMNRQAIVLAADSAATVPYWSESERQWRERYFKGANKIFQLSAHQPVGIMIYGTAALHAVPWELVVKDFRTNLGAKSFNVVGGYADEFFAFVRDHQYLFPPEYRDKVFIEEVDRAALTLLTLGAADDTVKAAGNNNDAKADAYRQLFGRISADVDGLEFDAPFEAVDLEAALGKYRLDAEKVVEETSATFGFKQHVDVVQLTDLAIRRLVKKPTAQMQSTGVVIAGYGDHEYFPSYREYQCHGLLLGRLLYKDGECRTVGPDRPAEIKAFATTDMVDTFRMGFGLDTYITIRTELRKTLRDFAGTIKTDLGHEGEIASLDQRIEEALKSYTENWTTAARREHAWPLLRVIGSLAVDEMADLAETLVELQSLKEKVTKPTESVGGPIDVAIISKADGFIWFKRKHYFDPKLNPRFLSRLSKTT